MVEETSSRMLSEYTLFNLIVAGSIAVSLTFTPYPAKVWKGHAFLAALILALPFLVWDSAVTDRHWWFNPETVASPRFFSLPFEEIAFFFTVPLACIFTWECAFAPLGAALPPPPAQGRAAHRRWWFVCVLIFGAAVAWAYGKEYTSLATLALAASMLADAWLAPKLWARPIFCAYLVVVSIFTAIFNTYLTARPVLIYDPRYQLDWRIGTIPCEDFIYGIALISGVIVVYEHLKLAFPRTVDVRLIGRLEALRHRLFDRFSLALRIRRKFGGYRHVVVSDQSSLAHSHSPKREGYGQTRVAIIGSGLAGLRAATLLQKRGFQVEIFERNAYLGGKIGAWSVPLQTGEVATVEHGFHAFFPHYYNTDRFLHEMKVRSSFRPVEDYLIVARDGQMLRYGAIARTPFINLASLLWHGHYRIRDALFNPRLLRLTDMLRYDAHQTFKDYDQVSYADFAENVRLPSSLRLAFNTFSRAFFAPPNRMSMAELIKSFHFFYLSHDGGLLYDYPVDNYQEAILDPIAAHLLRAGTKIHRSTAVESIRVLSDARIAVNGEPFDEVIVATDLPAAQRLLAGDESLAQHAPILHQRLRALEVSSRYAVLRLWMGKKLDFKPSPVFWITDRLLCLDAIAFYSEYEAQSMAWAQQHDGCVVELHSYCVPEDLAGEADVVAALLADLMDYLPILKDAPILDQHLYMRRDFPAFSLGQRQHRPATETEIPNLCLAGDWVALPWPMMLMEAAVTSGVVAANAIFKRHGLAPAPIESVPVRGLLTTRNSQHQEPIKS
jgi:isorenieratene synthase